MEKRAYVNQKEKKIFISNIYTKKNDLPDDVLVGINDIHCHLLLEESKGQGVQRLACQTLVS